MGYSKAMNDDEFDSIADVEDNSSSSKSVSGSISKGSTIHGEADERSLLLPIPKHGLITELPSERPRRMSHKRLISILTLIVFLVNCGDQLMDSPQTRIIEAIICYRYYEQHDPRHLQAGVGPGAVGGVAEALCKVDTVQEKLAMLRGYQQMLDGFPALLLAIPLGWAADRYGRKPLLSLGTVSFVWRAGWIQFVTWFWQAFDVRWTWLSTLHGLISGSSTVVGGLLFVMLSDITSEGERAAVFLRVGAASLLPSLLMPPLGAVLMDYNPWIPSLSGTVILILALCLSAIVPETKDYRHPTGSPSHSHPPSPSACSTFQAPTDTSTHLMERWLAKTKDATAFLWLDWRVPALILSFLPHGLLNNIVQLLLQYTSKRFGLRFSQATLLLTILSGVKVLLLFFILPYVSTTVMRIFQLSGQRKDLYLTRASQVFVLVGWTFVGLSPSIPVVACSMAIASLGQGTYLLARSFLASLVPANHIARVYSIISVVDTLGGMFGGALLAALFKQGMMLGGNWIGLPFLFVGLMSAILLGLMCIVRLKSGEGKLTVDHENA